MWFSGGEESVKGSYVEIKVDPSAESSSFTPFEEILTLGRGYTPQDVGHEIAHMRLGHAFDTTSISRFSEELEAWRDSLGRINPEEISISSLRRKINSYVQWVAEEYGRHSSQYRWARRKADELVGYARYMKQPVEERIYSPLPYFLINKVGR